MNWFICVMISVRSTKPTLWQKQEEVKNPDMLSSSLRSLKSFSHVTFTIRPTTPHSAFTTFV